MQKSRAIELRQLRHFTEIVKTSSFGRAADNLFLTQPAVSKSIRNLEQVLGVQLLERYAHGVVTTPYGDVFHRYATLILTELDRACDEIDHLLGQGGGLIRVGAGSSLMQYFLPEAVRRFVAGNDKIRIRVRQGLRERLLPMLQRGEIDMVIGSVKLDTEAEGIVQRPLFQDRIGVVAPREHPLASEPSVSLSDLARFEWVLPEASELEGDRLFRRFKEAGLTKPHVAIMTGSSAFMAALLKDTQYLSYLPLSLLSSRSEYGHLTALPTESIWAPIDVGVSYRKNATILPSTRSFIQSLRETADSLWQEETEL